MATVAEPRRRSAVVRAGDEIEMITSSLRKSSKNKLFTVSPELLWAMGSQPNKVKAYFRGEKYPRIQLNRERRLFYLLNCLMFTPSNFDSQFNVEVPPPYDYQTAEFANLLAEAISNRLNTSGEIDEAEIPILKKAIYDTQGYDVPQRVLEVELENNKAYLTYLLNLSDKITVSREEVALVRDCLKNTGIDLHAYGPFNLGAEAITFEIKKFANVSYLLSVNPPLMEDSLDRTEIYFGLFVENFNYKIDLNSAMMKASGAEYDVGLTYKILKQLKPDRNVSVSLRVIDNYSNTFVVRVGASTLDGLMKMIDERLTKGIEMLWGDNPTMLLDKRLGLEILTI